VKVIQCDFCKSVVNPLKDAHVEVAVWMADDGEKWKARMLHFCKFDCVAFWFAKHETDGFSIKVKP